MSEIPGHLPPRIARRLRYRAETGCWVWIGRINRNGYGRTRWRGKEPVAHRLVWELLVGPIPPGMLLDHLRDRCACRACCNPAHLEPVTPRENTLRGDAALFGRSRP